MLAKQQAARQGNPAKAWAVVKADAYGHGLLRVARALDDIADGFALLEMDAAVALREAGFRQPILLLEGFFERDDLDMTPFDAKGGLMGMYQQFGDNMDWVIWELNRELVA